MRDDRFEDFVKSAIHDLDPVPEVPREQMWARIEEVRRFRRRKERATWKRWTPWAVGAAALLAAGFGIGRLTTVPAVNDSTAPTLVAGNEKIAASPVTEPPGSTASGSDSGRGWERETTPPATTAGDAANAQYSLAALTHLSRAEVLLTSVAVGEVDQQLATWASDMLTTTRLILDTPAVEDPRVARLLEDLELILVQIASTTEDRKDAELRWIQQGLETNNVLPRLRAALPATAP